MLQLGKQAVHRQPGHLAALGCLLFRSTPLVLHQLGLTRPSDGTKLLLAVTTTPDELRLGIGELYIWIKYPGQSTFTFYEYITLSVSTLDQVADVSVKMGLVPYNQYTPEAIFNSCEWIAQNVIG